MFKLDPQLAHNSFVVGDLPLSTCRLVNNMQFPWLILVPRVAGVKEIYELSEQDQAQFLRESSWLSSQLATTFKADKMNVAAIGNQVEQLHFHQVVRYKNDIAWPNPVWGHESVQYNTEALNKMKQALMLALRGHATMPLNWQMS